MNGGVVEGATAYLVDSSNAPTVRDVVQFSGTEFRDYTTRAVRCYAVSGNTSLLMSDCYFVPNGAGDHVTASGTFEHLSRNGWVQGGSYYQPDAQGTWTPVLGDASNDATHSVQSATWRRDGDRVHVSGRITITSKGSVTGSLIIKSLPFSIKSGTYAGGVITYATGLTLPAAASVSLRALTGESKFGLFAWEGTAGPNNMVGTDISATTTIYFEATYDTDD